MLIRVAIYTPKERPRTEIATFDAAHIVCVSDGKIVVTHGRAYELVDLADEDALHDALEDLHGGCVALAGEE